MFIRGYQRRRGWSAWHAGALQRFSFDDGFPSLESMMGEVDRNAEAHRKVMMAHNLRLWRSVLNRKEAAGNA